MHNIACRFGGRAGAAALALLCLVAPRAAAQRTRLQGRVIDTNGAPVAQAEIVVLPESLYTSTSASGEFAVGPVAAGPHNIRVRRLGYQLVDTTVTTPAAAPFVFRMTPVPITLQTVVAEGLSAGLPRVVLREQEHLGVQLYGSRLQDLLHREPGMTVEDLLPFDRAAALKLMSSSGCPKVTFVDGKLTHAPIRYYVSTSEIAAIEVFNSADFVHEPFIDGQGTVDSAFRTGGCIQLVLVWSKYYKQPPWGGR